MVSEFIVGKMAEQDFHIFSLSLSLSLSLSFSFLLAKSSSWKFS